MEDRDELRDTMEKSAKIFTQYPTRPSIYTEYTITHNAYSESESTNAYNPTDKERPDVR